MPPYALPFTLGSFGLAGASRPQAQLPGTGRTAASAQAAAAAQQRRPDPSGASSGRSHSGRDGHSSGSDVLIPFLKGLASEVAPQCRFDTTVIKRIGAAAIEAMEDTLRRAYAVSKAQALKAGRQELRLTDTDLGMAIGRLSLCVLLSESVTLYTPFLVFCFVSFAVAHPQASTNHTCGSHQIPGK